MAWRSSIQGLKLQEGLPGLWCFGPGESFREVWGLVVEEEELQDMWTGNCLPGRNGDWGRTVLLQGVSDGTQWLLVWDVDGCQHKGIP